MSFESGLDTYLKAHVGLSALVGARVYPMTIPEGTTEDCVTWQVLPGRELHFGNYVAVTVLIKGWSKTLAGAIAIDAQLRDALESYHGDLDGIHAHIFTNPRGDDYEPDTGWYCRMREARPYYKAA